MKKYAMQIAYDGTDFCGWQIQKGKGVHANLKPSIQGTLADAIKQMCGAAVSVVGSGRTDAGVHASGQVAHFRLETDRYTPENLLKGLNSILPSSIQIHRLGRVPDDFHAQRAALKKQYSFYFQQGLCQAPQLRPYTWWVRRSLDGEMMQEALQYLLGEHDFLPFRASGAKVTSTVRTLYEADVTRLAVPQPGCFDPEQQFLWRVRLVGSGFLKQMVRGIAGTLQQIGNGRRSPLDMRNIMQTQDRQKVGPTAPARGLWLDRVWYPSHLGLDVLHSDP
jgi:tRNA pseudouridine38-40 synthase